MGVHDIVEEEQLKQIASQAGSHSREELAEKLVEVYDFKKYYARDRVSDSIKKDILIKHPSFPGQYVPPKEDNP